MLKNTKYLLFFTLLVLLFGIGASCGKNTPSTTTNDAQTTSNNGTKKTQLTMWGVFDDSSVIQPLIDAFNKERPSIEISYAKKEFADYEALLVDAIASNEGPDIFLLHNDWLPKHRAKLSPATEEDLSVETYGSLFIDSAQEDFTADNKVYGVPLYTDNLALYYNTDLFRSAQLYGTPKTWDEVLEYAKKLTKTAPGDPTKIVTSGIALGTADTVVRSSDILLAIMMQTGTPIISDDKRSFNFNQFRKNQDGSPYYPGTEALSFYTSFANPNKSSYSWNGDLGDSITAFAQGKTAMLIGYSYFQPLIQRINPALSFDIADFPQIKGASSDITVANYWGWGVSRASENKDASWDFLAFLAQNPVTKQYLSATQRISPKIDQNNRDSFGTQASRARTIFKGNSDEFDKAFVDMINDVVRFGQTYQSAIDTAARTVNEMLRRYY